MKLQAGPVKRGVGGESRFSTNSLFSIMRTKEQRGAGTFPPDWVDYRQAYLEHVNCCPLVVTDRKDWSVRCRIRQEWAQSHWHLSVDWESKQWPIPEKDLAVKVNAPKRTVISYFAMFYSFTIKALAVNNLILCLNIEQPHCSSYLLIPITVQKGDNFHCNQTLYNSVIMLNWGLKEAPEG